MRSFCPVKRWSFGRVALKGESGCAKRSSSSCNDSGPCRYWPMSSLGGKGCRWLAVSKHHTSLAARLRPTRARCDEDPRRSDSECLRRAGPECGNGFLRAGDQSRWRIARPAIEAVRESRCQPTTLGELLAHPRRLHRVAPPRRPVVEQQWPPRAERCDGACRYRRKTTRRSEKPGVMRLPPRARPVSAHQHGSDASEDALWRQDTIVWGLPGIDEAGEASWSARRRLPLALLRSLAHCREARN